MVGYIKVYFGNGMQMQMYSLKKKQQQENPKQIKTKEQNKT